MKKYPLVIQFVYNPESADAEGLAQSLHDVFNRNRAVPGLQIPTRFMPMHRHVPDISSQLLEEAEQIVYVLLLDDYITTNHKNTEPVTWSKYILDICRQAQRKKSNARLIPIQLTRYGLPDAPPMSNLNAVRAWAISDRQERDAHIARYITQNLIRYLLPEQKNKDAVPIEIFISHTKLDLNTDPFAVNQLIEYLTINRPVKGWYDEGDIEPGSEFGERIFSGVEKSSMLVIATDHYSTRTWCRKELIHAKLNNRPIVVANAISNKENRSFPYLGNVPVIRWQNNPREVIDLVLQETLRSLFVTRVLQNEIANQQFIPNPPELLTLKHHSQNHRRKNTKVYFYPDPPLNEEERLILQNDRIHYTTPLQHFADQHQPTRLPMIALSISESSDIGDYGLRKCHLDEFYFELSRYLLLAGYRLAYGGDLRNDGYTLRLVDVTHDPALEVISQSRPARANNRKPLVCYRPWPKSKIPLEASQVLPVAEWIACPKPAEKFFNFTTGKPIGKDSLRRFEIALGLTEMRRKQSKECLARIVIGGKLGRKNDEYSGILPGTLEETLYSIQYSKPVYLIGAFGGCAKALSDQIVHNIPRNELTEYFQALTPHRKLLEKLYTSQRVRFPSLEEFSKTCDINGSKMLNNGLDSADNLVLSETRSPEKIVELILKGLYQHQPRRKSVT